MIQSVSREIDWYIYPSALDIESDDQDFLLKQSHGSLFQSPLWSGLVEKGKAPLVVIARQSDVTVFAAVVERHFIPKTKYFSALVRRGPVFSDSELALSLWPAFEKQLISIGAFRLSVFPYWEREDLQPLEQSLTNQGYTLDNTVTTHQHSATIDLAPELDKILMTSVSSKTRNMIRKGDKLGVVTRLIANEQELEKFWKMHRTTCIKKGSEGPDLAMFMNIWRLSEQHPGSCACVIAELENEMIGGCIILRHGERAVYTWGSSTDIPMKGVPKTELVLWASIAWAKEAGLSLFDLGGITPDAEKGSAAAGINRFKKGFSSHFIELFPAYCKVFNMPVDKIYSLLKQVMAFFRNSK